MKIRITFPWCVLLLLLLLHVFLLSFSLLLLSLLLMKRYSEIYNFKAALFANSKWLRIESRRASLKSPQRKCKLNDATRSRRKLFTSVWCQTGNHYEMKNHEGPSAVVWVRVLFGPFVILSFPAPTSLLLSLPPFSSLSLSLFSQFIFNDREYIS